MCLHFILCYLCFKGHQVEDHKAKKKNGFEQTERNCAGGKEPPVKKKKKKNVESGTDTCVIFLTL